MTETETAQEVFTIAYIVPEIGSEEAPNADGADSRHPGATMPRRASEGPNVGTTAPTGAPVSGLLLSTWSDAWTFCKATSKSVGAHHWVPWLGGATAVLSAITATQIFTSLQDDQVSTAARVLVGAVVVLATAITALQTWTGSRIKGLNDQFAAFHDLHRKIQRDVEARGAKPLADNYAHDVETELRGIMASMIPVSNRTWDRAKRDVVTEMGAELHRLGISKQVPTN